MPIGFADAIKLGWMTKWNRSILQELVRFPKTVNVRTDGIITKRLDQMTVQLCEWGEVVLLEVLFIFIPKDQLVHRARDCVRIHGAPFSARERRTQAMALSGWLVVLPRRWHGRQCPRIVVQNIKTESKSSHILFLGWPVRGENAREHCGNLQVALF
jgi:hypothetical protein